jgi:2,3-dihydroxybenzoate---[aryl-carrier protein] ligase
MLEGVVPFPPDYAARYRAKGYWRDKSLAAELGAAFKRFAERVAIVSGERSVTYAELDQQSTNLALNLLDLGLKPLDRVVVQLPNVYEFACLYVALQKIGCIPIAALVTHRYREIAQFTELSGAVACVMPDRIRDFEFAPMIARVRAEHPSLRHGIILGAAPDGYASLTELIDRPAKRPAADLAKIEIDPVDPAVFQLSGGTTGIPKLIPRTHNDYAYNSKIAAEVTEIGGDAVLLLVLPIAHNLPLACPGLQGVWFNGAKVVLGTSARARDVFKLVEQHGVTHIPLVPTLLIDWINDPALADHDLSSIRIIQSGGQRLQPQTKLKTRGLFPGVFVQENFGMAEGTLMFVRRDDSEDAQLETAGRPISPDDEVRLVDDDDKMVKPGEVGELCCRGPYTLRGYYGVPDYNARAFTSDGFYRSGDLMRQHPSGNFIVEGRKKDLINRGGEKISAEEIENLILSHPAVTNVACVPYPDERLGERMCACVILKSGASLTLKDLSAFLEAQEIARHKLPERLEIMTEFPVSTFGKVSKKSLVEMVGQKLAAAS